MRKFYVCSVGQPGKGYDDINFQRIISNKAFVLHENAPQKGVYEQIRRNDILLLKYNNHLVAYGESLGNQISNEEEWNLTSPVHEWNFHDSNNLKQGVSNYGIGDNTLPGAGQMGVVKEVNIKFAINKINIINSKSALYKVIINEIYENNKMSDLNNKIELLKYKNKLYFKGLQVQAKHD